MPGDFVLNVFDNFLHLSDERGKLLMACYYCKDIIEHMVVGRY